MPISRGSFEQGNIDAPAEVWRFLRSNSENAYTIYEVYQNTVTMLGLTIDDLRAILSELVDRGRIRSKRIEGEDYFRAGDHLGFRTPGR